MAIHELEMSEDDLRAAIGMWLAWKGYPNDSTFLATMRMDGAGDDVSLTVIDVTVETPDRRSSSDPTATTAPREEPAPPSPRKP